MKENDTNVQHSAKGLKAKYDQLYRSRNKVR